MKVLKSLIIVTILVTSSSLMAKEPASRLNQVRNSLWVFGVDTKSAPSADLELIQQTMMLDEGVSEQEAEAFVEIPEELEMAVYKFNS